MTKPKNSLNQTIYEVTGEHFFTNYGKDSFGIIRKNSVIKNQSPSNREQIVNFKIDETAKCVCFCE